MYRALDIFFFVFHTTLIVFILVGWLPKKTRKIHLAAVVLTIFSWFFLGIWFGFGYCPCTDWHWRVREHLGDQDLPFSYIKFLIDRATGYDANPTLVDAITVTGLALPTVASIWLNIRDRKRSQCLDANSHDEKNPDLS